MAAGPVGTTQGGLAGGENPQPGQPTAGAQGDVPMGGGQSGMGSTQPQAGQGGGAAGGTPSGSEQPPLEQRVFDAGSDPDRNVAQAGALCARLAEIQCAGEAYCCEAPGRDRAACESEMQEGCEDVLYLDAISLNRISGFDEDAASAALEELESLASNCDPSIASFSLSPDGLAGIFAGTKDSGANCGPGLSTDTKVAAASLASCRDLATTACLPTSLLSWSCTARGGAGSRCFTELNCQEGMYCPNPELEIAGASCTPRKELGASCSTGDECVSLFCEAGSCVAADSQNAYCLAE